MRAAVTVAAAAGWLAGLVLVGLLRHTTAPPAPAFAGGATTVDRLRVQLGRGAGSLAGCIVAGVLVMGFGGRLMMRVLAATSSDGVQGAITDMEAVVGRVTLGGTVGFVVFVGAGAGLIGWLLRLACRRWLPDRSVVAGLVGAGIGAGLLARGSSLLDPSSEDFEILTPDWLSVALILGLIVSFGVLLSVLADRLVAVWPTPGPGVRWLLLAPLGALVFVPPVAVVLGLATVGRTRFGDRIDAGLRRVDPAARVVVGALAALGGAATLWAAWTILFLT